MSLVQATNKTQSIWRRHTAPLLPLSLWITPRRNEIGWWARIFFNIFFSALLRKTSFGVSGCPGCAKICLKMLCQEDITVLGQSVQKSSLSAFTHIQNASEELWNRYQTNFIREHSLQYCLGGYCRLNIKTWKSWPNVSTFQSMSILAIRCNKRQANIFNT